MCKNHEEKLKEKPTTNEAVNSASQAELSDDDLEKVAGGTPGWISPKPTTPGPMS